jgi:hypothetical protein
MKEKTITLKLAFTRNGAGGDGCHDCVLDTDCDGFAKLISYCDGGEKGCFSSVEEEDEQ